MPGPRPVRIRELRRLLCARGEKITTDGLVSSLSLAIGEDREAKTRRVRELSQGGRSVREIGRTLSIPPATVERLRGNRQFCPRIDDLPSPPTPTSPISEIVQPNQKEDVHEGPGETDRPLFIES